MRNYPTNKLIDNHIDEVCSFDLADMIDYKISNKKGFRYIFVIIENFSKNTWCILLKKKQSNKNTRNFKYSNIIQTIIIQNRKQ